jgi:hypothetical protein
VIGREVGIEFQYAGGEKVGIRGPFPGITSVHASPPHHLGPFDVPQLGFQHDVTVLTVAECLNSSSREESYGQRIPSRDGLPDGIRSLRGNYVSISKKRVKRAKRFGAVFPHKRRLKLPDITQAQVTPDEPDTGCHGVQQIIVGAIHYAPGSHKRKLKNSMTGEILARKIPGGIRDPGLKMPGRAGAGAESHGNTDSPAQKDMLIFSI